MGRAARRRTGGDEAGKGGRLAPSGSRRGRNSRDREAPRLPTTDSPGSGQTHATGLLENAAVILLDERDIEFF